MIVTLVILVLIVLVAIILRHRKDRDILSEVDGFSAYGIEILAYDEWINKNEDLIIKHLNAGDDLDESISKIEDEYFKYRKEKVEEILLKEEESEI